MHLKSTSTYSVGDKDLVQIGIMQFESNKSSGAQSNSLYDATANTWMELAPYAIRSGPRKTIYHDPQAVTAAIVTCGGLCPGLNDVVQNIVYTLQDHGVPQEQIFGVKFGLRGFLDRHTKPINLDRACVDGIQLRGGTILGTSRGNAKMHEIVDRLRLWGVTMLFVIGGNGGNAAAHSIAQECERQGVVCNVVGVPKSIDNDIQLIDKCFGFDTAVEEAQRALICARVEAKSAAGIAIVKLMGRSSGFISLNASMASGVVDLCLIPEIPFTIPKVVAFVKKILAAKDFCVICVAEGESLAWTTSGSKPRAPGRTSCRPAPPAAPTPRATQSSRTSAPSCATSSTRPSRAWRCATSTRPT